MRSTLALLLLAGCGAHGTAATNGPTLGYTDGAYFWLKHKGAQTAGPETRLAPGGEIAGLTCGTDVFYDVWLRGPSARNLTGFVRRAIVGGGGESPSHLSVRDRRGQRLVEGAVGDTVGTSVVDVAMTPERLTGRIALRHYDLHAEDDDLVGTVVGGVFTAPTRFVAHGRSALWGMSPEMQAVLVPFLLSCRSIPNRHLGLSNFGHGYPLLEVDFRAHGIDETASAAPRDPHG